MTVSCPDPDCGHIGPSGRGIATHWARSSNHSGHINDVYPDFDTSSTKEHSRRTSEALQGREIAWGDKISETLQGRSYLSDEHYEKVAELMEGNDYAAGYERTPAQLKALEKGRRMSPTEDMREKVSESLKGNHNWRRKQTYIEELGYSVDSTWELHTAFYLEAIDIDYIREPAFELSSGRTYYPDFQSGSVVIEVKGYADEYSIEKAESFLAEYPEYEYVVVGAEMPCDEHISWDERDQLLGTLGIDMTQYTVIA